MKRTYPAKVEDLVLRAVATRSGKNFKVAHGPATDEHLPNPVNPDTVQSPLTGQQEKDRIRSSANGTPLKQTQANNRLHALRQTPKAAPPMVKAGSEAIPKTAWS